MPDININGYPFISQSGTNQPQLTSNVDMGNSTFPIGHVIQTKAVTVSNHFDFAPGTTWYELESGTLGAGNGEFRVSITPTSTSNKLLMTICLQLNDSGVNDISNWKFWDVTGATEVTPLGIANGDRFRCHWTTRHTDYDSNDTISSYYTLFADIARTTETVYTVYARNGDGNGTMFINYTQSNNGSWGGTMVSSFIIQEIQQ